MESLFKPMKLSPEVNRVLEEVRKGAENALYCAEPAAADKLLHEHVESLIEGAGLTSMQVIHYRWFLREIARLWRTRQGRDLAFHLELCLRKWKNLGLEPKTLQFLICESHERLKGQNLTTKTQSHQEPGDPAKTGTVPRAVRSYGGEATRTAPPCHSERATRVEESHPGETPPSASGRHSVSSAKSADALRDPSTPLRSAQGDSASSASSAVSAYDARMCQPMAGSRPPARKKSAKPTDANPNTKTQSHQENPGSDTGPLDSSHCQTGAAEANPGVLP